MKNQLPTAQVHTRVSFETGARSNECWFCQIQNQYFTAIFERRRNYQKQTFQRILTRFKEKFWVENWFSICGKSFKLYLVNLILNDNLHNIYAKNRPFENVLLFFPDTSESQKSEQFNQQEFYEKCDVNTDQLVVENKDVKNAAEDTVYTLTDINDDTASSGPSSDEESTSNESSSNSSC